MKGDLPHVLLGLGLLAAVAWLPGIALCRVLAPTLSRLVVLAAAPAASAGFLYGAGEFATSFGLAVDGRLALGAVIAACGSLLWTERGSWAAWQPRRVPPSIVGAWLLGTGIWTAGIRHLLAVPPHNDGYNHGYFVARIAEFATLDPATVIPHDVVSGGVGAAFYPLALHQQAAVLVRVAHLDVGVAWTLTSLSLVVLALPLGMYVLGRHLFPNNARAAAACAWVAALTPGISYSTTWWGGFPFAAAIALTPGALLCALYVRERGTRARSVALGALAITGIAGVHTSEVPLLAAIAGFVLIGPPLIGRQARQAAAAAVQAALPFAASLLLLLPVLRQIADGRDERTFAPATEGLPFAKTVLEVLVQFSFVPPATPPALAIAALVGIALALRRRTGLAWLGVWVLFAVLYVWVAAFPSELVNTLTSSWYSDRFRLGMLLTFLAIPFAGLAVAGPVMSVGTRAAATWRAAAWALAAVLGITATHDSVVAIRDNYRDYSLVGADDRAAFAYLARHARPGERVLNQHQDGSPWMYSLYGVAPVFAVKTNNYESADWEDALYLSRNAHLAGWDPRTDALLDEFKVRYVFVGDDAFTIEEADLRTAELLSSPAYRLVFERGDTHVFERVAP